VSESDRRQALAHGERIGAGYALTAPRRARATTQGARAGARAGGSLEFRDYRDYEPGDDVRNIDWNLMARSDRLVVKQFHEETAPALDLILDGSRSMALTPAKARATLGVAALVATAAANAGFPTRTYLAGDRVLRVAGGKRPSQWDDVAFEFSGTPAAALARAGGALRPLSLRVIVSDFLWPADPGPLVQSLAVDASRVVLVRILAAEDATPDVKGAWQLVDCETGERREIVFDSAAASRYAAALARHEELWRLAARNANATVVEAVAEEIAETLVFEELLAADVMRPAWSR
jgi:uncharacterized protein (DUF58 family)